MLMSPYPCMLWYLQGSQWLIFLWQALSARTQCDSTQACTCWGGSEDRNRLAAVHTGVNVTQLGVYLPIVSRTDTG